MKTQNHKHIFS